MSLLSRLHPPHKKSIEDKKIVLVKDRVVINEAQKPRQHQKLLHFVKK